MSTLAVIVVAGVTAWLAVLFLTWIVIRAAAMGDRQMDRDLEADRWRRGAAGWEKPVSPPRREDLPRGLPPRVREHR